MKGYRLHWHTVVGAGLLFVLWITIFFPGLSFRADSYIDAAVSANRYALGKDENITGAGEIVEDYEPGGAGRAGIERAYRRRAREITGGDTLISRMFLARWALTVKERLDFEGVQLRQGMTLRDTDVREVFRLWGWLIYLPFLAVTFTLVFMLVKRRTLPGVLLFDGLLTILCECLGRFLIPSMVWEEARRAALSFELVGQEALNQYGTGEKFVKELFSRCSGVSWIIVIVLSVLVTTYSILGLALQLRKRRAGELQENYRISPDTGIWDKTGSMAKKASVRENGILRGIKGEYAGESVSIRAGEELVLGRDPRYCMLIFGNPRVSRRQCGIRYDAVNGCYQAVDYSAGGTALSNGMMLSASEYTVILPGTVIHMAGDSEIFMVM